MLHGRSWAVAFCSLILFCTVITITSIGTATCKAQPSPADDVLSLTPEEATWLADHPTLRVHNELDLPPFNFNVTGKPKGFSIDYMNLLAQRIGVQVQYIHGPQWDEFQNMMKDGTLDVMLNIAETPKRQEFLTFTPAYIEMAQMLFTRKGMPRVSSITDLFGKTIAVPKGFFFQEFINKYPEITALEVQNTEEAIYAVSSGRADYVHELMPIVNYFTEKLQITNIDVGGAIPEMKSSNSISLHIATAKDNTILASILTKAMLTITDDDMWALRQRWLGGNPLTIQSKPGIALSSHEQMWLDQRTRPIVVGAEMDWPPFDFVENGSPTGYSNELLKLAAEKANIPIQFEYGLSWAQLIEKFNKHEIDVLPAIYHTPERAQNMAFTRQYAANPYVLITHETSHVQTLDDMAGKTVAVIEASSIIKTLEIEHPEIKQAFYSNALESLKAVSLKKADAFIGSFGVVTYLLKKNILPNLTITNEVVFGAVQSQELFMATQKDQPILRDIIQKALDAITTQENNTLRATWLTLPQESQHRLTIDLTPKEQLWLKTHPQIRLGVDSSWSPFEFIDNNTHKGLSAAYTSQLVNDIGLNIAPLEQLPWQDILDKAASGKLDLLPCVPRTLEREKFLNFSAPYATFPYAVYQRIGSNPIQDMKELEDLKTAVIIDYAVEELLKQSYEGFEPIRFRSTEEALQALSRGKVDAAIINFAAAEYVKRTQFILNVKATTRTPFSQDLYFGVRKDWPELVSIINKWLGSLNEEDHNKLKQEAGVTTEVLFYGDTPRHWDYTQMLTIGSGLILVFGLTAILLLFLKKYVRGREHTLYNSHQFKTVGIFVTILFLCLVVAATWI